MDKIIYRKNKMFHIDTDKLSSKANKTDIILAIYSAVYTEFSGANNNPDYKDLTNLEKLDKVNQFVNKWLNERGLV